MHNVNTYFLTQIKKKKKKSRSSFQAPGSELKFEVTILKLTVQSHHSTATFIIIIKLNKHIEIGFLFRFDFGSACVTVVSTV